MIEQIPQVEAQSAAPRAAEAVAKNEQAAQQAVTALRGQVDWVIALSHLGQQRDQRLLELFPQIDVILGGHSHPQITKIEELSGTLTSYPRPYAKEAVLITLGKQQDAIHYDSRVIELL